MAAAPNRPTMDGVFRALADPGRRRLLDRLNAYDGQTLRELCAGMDMARQSVSKHLAVLEAANLVTTLWRGREKLHYLNPAPISDINERWINRYEQQVHALADLKTALESPPMPNPSFVYTTYIQTTPEQLWQALIGRAFTERYWNAWFETDWAAGSPMVWNLHGVRIADPDQVVLESDPPRRLSYTWHSFTPELASALGRSDDAFAVAAREPRSKVTFELEPIGSVVKLTVIHDDFPPVSQAAELVSHGWPQVLSKLKTLIETGETFRIERVNAPDAQ